MANATPCRCGHVQEAHEHYRRGTDCAICGAEQCRSFVPASSASAQPELRPDDSRSSPSAS